MEHVRNMVELVRLVRRGPESSGNAVRVENLLITNPWGMIRNNASRIITLIIMFVVIGFMMFLYIGSTILAGNQPQIHSIDIQNTDVEFVWEADSVSLEGKITLQVSFTKTNNVKIYPLTSSYFLSKVLNDNHTLSAVSKSRYRISQDEQLLVLKFVSSPPVHLQEQELRDLQRKIDKRQIWMQLLGDFKMKIRLARFLVVPYAYNHLYFGCHMFFSDVCGVDKMDFGRCETLKETQQ